MSQTDTQSTQNGGKASNGGPPASFTLTEVQFRAFLKSLAEQAGCMAELGRQMSVTAQFIGDVIAGRKRAGPKLLGKLGAKATVIYEVTVLEAE